MRGIHLLKLSTPLGEIRGKPLFHACLLLRLVLDAPHLLVRVLDITDVLTDAVDLRRLHIVLAQEAVPPGNKALDGLGLRHLLAIDFKNGQPAHVDIVFALRLGSIRLLPQREATTWSGARPSHSALADNEPARGGLMHRASAGKRAAALPVCSRGLSLFLSLSLSLSFYTAPP